jgi:hypothetical protein
MLHQLLAKTVGLGVKKTRKTRTRKGKGFIGNSLGLSDPNKGPFAKTVGLGVKTRKPHKNIGTLVCFLPRPGATP